MKTQILNRIILITVLAVSCGLTTQAQSEKHHISVLSTTAQHFSWVYQITPTLHKNIEYFIVEDSFGGIKVAFNACDVCYGAYLGYAQNGTNMQCNNCGNQYAIDNLGTAGTGGCWPGYLPHTVVVDSIVITHADLIAGAYYFQLINTTGIDELNGFDAYNLIKNQSEWVLNMHTAQPREIKIFGINGQQVYANSTADAQTRINTNGFSNGVYIIAVKEKGEVYTRKIFID